MNLYPIFYQFHSLYSRESEQKVTPKFQIENSMFISSTVEITAFDILKDLKARIARGEIPRKTIFYELCGIHHGMGPDGKAILGHIDEALLNFYHAVFSSLNGL